jgi:hypothetical protein
MSTTVRWDLGAMKKIASSKVTINSATTTSFDFGTPDDINLASAASATAGYSPGDRVLVVLTASTGGTTNNLTWVIQDAPDSSGSIGTPATAVTSAVAGALAATTGDDYSMFAVKVQPSRPWLRVRVTSDGATDTFVCHCSVYALPSGM